MTPTTETETFIDTNYSLECGPVGDGVRMGREGGPDNVMKVTLTYAFKFVVKVDDKEYLNDECIENAIKEAIETARKTVPFVGLFPTSAWLSDPEKRRMHDAVYDIGNDGTNWWIED